MLFNGSSPCFQGNQGPIGRGGKLILDLRGPFPLSSFGSEECGIVFSLSLASGLFVEVLVSLERGTSSSFLTGEFPGHFIGEMTFLSLLFSVFFFADVGPCFPVPDGPGLGSPLEFSVGTDLGLLLGLITREPGFEDLLVVSGSGNLTPVSSSSEGSTSPSSLESLELELEELEELLWSAISAFRFSWNCCLLFNLLIICLLSSLPVSRNFSPLTMVCSR